MSTTVQDREPLLSPPPVTDLTLPPDAKRFATNAPTISSCSVPVYVSSNRVFLPTVAQLDAMVKEGRLARPEEVFVTFIATKPSRKSCWRTLRRKVESWVAGPWHHPELVVRFGPKYYRLTIMEQTPAVWIYTIDSREDFVNRNTYYEIIPLSLTPGAIWRAILHYETQIGKPFNTAGYIMYYTPGLRWLSGDGDENEESWTCVQLTTSILISADHNTYGDLSRRKTTPGVLYHRCSTKGRTHMGL